MCWSPRGKLVEAEPYFHEALEWDRSATTLNNMAFVHSKQGEHAEAEPYYHEALEMSRRVDGEGEEARRFSTHRGKQTLRAAFGVEV